LVFWFVEGGLAFGMGDIAVAVAVAVIVVVVGVDIAGEGRPFDIDDVAVVGMGTGLVVRVMRIHSYVGSELEVAVVEERRQIVDEKS
jgi:uncharacterized membrane protein YccF (DUF307 family)